MKKQFIVAVGNIHDGYEFWGPFDSESDAVAWRGGDGNMGQIVPLFVPESR